MQYAGVQKKEKNRKSRRGAPRRFNLIQNSRSSRGPKQVAHPAITADCMCRGLVFNMMKWPSHSSYTAPDALKCPTATQLAPKPVCNGAWLRAATARAPIGWRARTAANVTKKQKKPPAPKKKNTCRKQRRGVFSGSRTLSTRKGQQMKIALADLLFFLHSMLIKEEAELFIFVCVRTFCFVTAKIPLLGREQSGLHQVQKS